MATWKKIIVSGSNAELAQVTASIGVKVGSNTLGANATNTFLSGSFSGSFFGDGSGLTGVSAAFPGTQKTPIIGTDKVFINDGISKFATISQFNSSSWAGVSGDVTIDGNTGVATLSSAGVKNALPLGTVSASAFSSPSQGTVRAVINGVQTDVDTGLQTGDSPQFVDLTLTGDIAVNGGDITTSAGTFNVATAATTINLGTTNTDTINIGKSGTSNVNVNNNLTVTGNLTVNGTTTTIDTTNLLVEDKFALFASGSDTNTDGGIVVQQGVTTGYALGVDASADRWALQNNASPTATSITPDAFVGVIQEGAVPPSADPVYGGSSGNGTVFINTANGDIWIYS